MSHDNADKMMMYAKDALITAPSPQGEPVVFCEDAALTIAERTFRTEVDEQLANDIIQYAQRLHSLYTAPQPSPDVTQLVDALEEIDEWISRWCNEHHPVARFARKVLTTHQLKNKLDKS